LESNQLNAEALKVLESAWNSSRGYCPPNKKAYPHMWLWDSCFHSIAWSAFHDQRAVVELHQAMKKQFSNGFLPHMVYAKRTLSRGPRKDVSSFTQPPIYALAIALAHQNMIAMPGSLIHQMSQGLSYFIKHRLRDGLAFVVHPWETGCDDSPRWDSWLGTSAWKASRWFIYDHIAVAAANFGEEGDAIWSKKLVSSPSLFNAILSHAFLLASQLTGDPRLSRTSYELGEAMDELLWDDSQGMYVDLSIVGGGESCRAPVLDGVLSALGSVRRDHALACLEQLRDPLLFAAPFGLRYLPVKHSLYRPDSYWRGPAWPPLEFLAIQACRRWNLDDLASQISDCSRRGIFQSGWAEYLNPETGCGLGARPQTWATLAAMM
jgi:hypothetical protein